MIMNRREQLSRHDEIRKRFSEVQAESAARRTRVEEWWNTGPYMISSVSDALAALQVRSLDELAATLSALLAPYEVTHEDGWLHESGSQGTMLALGHTGAPLVEPGGSEDLRLTVGALAEAADQEDQMEMEALVAALIQSVEGFRVYVNCRSWGAEPPPEPFLYPYLKPALGKWTVKEWTSKRVDSQVPHLGPGLPSWEIVPYLSSGELAPEHYYLDELRRPTTARS